MHLSKPIKLYSKKSKPQYRNIKRKNSLKGLEDSLEECDPPKKPKKQKQKKHLTM